MITSRRGPPAASHRNAGASRWHAWATALSGKRWVVTTEQTHEDDSDRRWHGTPRGDWRNISIQEEGRDLSDAVAAALSGPPLSHLPRFFFRVPPDENGSSAVVFLSEGHWKAAVSFNNRTSRVTPVIFYSRRGTHLDPVMAGSNSDVSHAVGVRETPLCCGGHTEDVGEAGASRTRPSCSRAGRTFRTQHSTERHPSRCRAHLMDTLSVFITLVFKLLCSTLL